MQLVGELNLTFAAYRRLALTPAGPKIWIYRAVGVFLLACEAYLASFGPLEDDGYLIVLLGLALLTGTDALVLLGWSRHRGLAAQRPFRYELTASTLRINTAQTDASVGWAAISQMRVRRDGWLFRVAATGRSLVVPRAAFSAQAQAEIDAFVRDRGGH